MTASTGPRTAVQDDVFRDVIGRFASGVTVITRTADDGDHGTTASAVSSLSGPADAAHLPEHRRGGVR